MAPTWFVRRSPGGYETIDLEDPASDDGHGLRSILRAEELEKAMEGRQIRMALGCVSAFLGLWVVFRVWRDSYIRSRAEPRPNSSRLSFLWQLHPAEVFPLIIGFAIFWPTLILVSIQGTGLKSIAVGDCKTTGALALPAVLALGMFHLVYGLEVTLRALSSIPFRKASKWRTAINLTFVTFFLLFIFIVGITLGDYQDRCFGTVGFRVSSLHVNKGIFVLLFILMFAFVAMAVIITIRLMQVVHLDVNERIAASRMVYYLVVSTIVQVLLLPFFIQEYFETEDSQLTASTLAEYVLFASGGVLAFVHLFLRANAGVTAIRHRATPWQGRTGFRMFGRNDLDIINISRPINVAPPSSYDPDEKYAEFVARQETLKRKRSQRRKVPGSPMTQKQDISSPLPIAQDLISSLPTINPEPSPTTSVIADKSPSLTPITPFGIDMSYKNYQGTDEPTLPAAIYSPPARSISASKVDAKSTKSSASPKLLPPIPRKPVVQAQIGLSSPRPPPFALGGLPAPSVTDVRDFSNIDDDLRPPKAPWTHHRNESETSTATVQIGIRFSSADDAVLPGIGDRRPSSTVLPSTVYQPPTRPAKPLARSKTNPTSIKFASGLQNQFKQSIVGRDLNSFRWLDTPGEDAAPGSQSRSRDYFSSETPTSPSTISPFQPDSVASALTQPAETERRLV